MSVEAMAWAKRQNTGSMGAKSVLRALADYADEDGCCWPSRRQLADDTEMSPGSVSRHLAALEAGRLIVREERLRDNGSRSTDMVRLLMARAPAPATPSSNWGGPPPQIEEAPSSISGSAPPQIEEAHNYHPNHHLKKDSPQAPQGAGVGSSISEMEEGGEPDAPDTQFDVFWTQYAAHPLASRAKALRVWSKLDTVQRAQALAQLERFLDLVKQSGRKPCDPATYLGERRWEALATLQAPVARAEAADKAPAESDPVRKAVDWALNDKAPREHWVFVEEGSGAWLDWHAAFIAVGLGHRFARGRPTLVKGIDGEWGRPVGRWFPMARPPAGVGPPAARGAPTDDEIAENI